MTIAQEHPIMERPIMGAIANRACIAAMLLLAGAAVAGEAPMVTAWARATPGDVTNGALYLVVKEGAAADAITGVATPAATMATLHSSEDDRGVMKMRDIGQVPLPANATMTMRPGGTHVMLMSLAHPLRVGDSFPVTVTFQHAAPVTVTASVAGIGASAP